MPPAGGGRGGAATATAGAGAGAARAMGPVEARERLAASLVAMVQVLGEVRTPAKEEAHEDDAVKAPAPAPAPAVDEQQPEAEQQAQPLSEASPTAAEAPQDNQTRRSARQASRPAAKRKPWEALMAGWKGWEKEYAEEEEDNEDEAARRRRKRNHDKPSAPTRPRTVGEVPVQVFRGLVPQAAINLIMKGEQAALGRRGSSSGGAGSTERDRNPWPGVQNLLRTFMARSFATNFRHPYIAEISSRCDSIGPPQRLDLRLTPSGVRALLTPPAIAAIEAVVWGLTQALQFTGRVTWDSHVVIVLPGAPVQRFHVDSARSWFYFTLLVPLTKDPPKAGRTEFHAAEDQPRVPVGVGDVLLFGGKRKHRGQANATKHHTRVFLYIAVYSGTDYN